MKYQIHMVHKTIRGEEERMELVEKKSGLSSRNLLGRAQMSEEPGVFFGLVLSFFCFKAQVFCVKATHDIGS